ncbi:hypothetical protein ACIPSE_39755 [Streptomyces sp. NPDC090106]|uniref:hypothetical protein n=1 Tax=Streptomyces sp. NPDC090106 TaxID=3365946 RepID=UPI00382E2FD8
MDIARHIALIDELCLRPFPAEHAFHLAELAAGHGLREVSDPAERAAAVDRYHHELEAVRDGLAPRRGEPHHLNLQTVQLRRAHEEIPEPWASRSDEAGFAYLWEDPGTGRWIAVAVADRDPADEVRLLAVVTVIDPP